MKQADKRALEAYPIDSYEGHDDMYRQRGAFAKGYEQAEKDLMDKAKQNVNERLNEFRNFLISETEKYQKRANNPDASECGKHYDRGQANGFILARGTLEKLFDLWDNL